MKQSVMTTVRSGHWPSLLGAWLHFEVSFMVWLLLGAMSVSLAESLALTGSQVGVLLAMPLLSGAIWRVPVGLASDRLGAKRVGGVILCAELVGLAIGWSGVAGFPGLLLVALVLGVAGASFAVALPIAARAYPPASQGFALGVAASANSGIVLAMWVGPRLATSLGWQATFGWMALPVVLTALVFMLCVKPDAPRPAIGGAQAEGTSLGALCRTILADVRREPSWRWLSGLYAITFGGFVGLSSILPVILHDRYGLSVVEAGSVTALCGLTGTLVRPVGGVVADRMGGLRVLPVILVGLAGCLSGMAALPPVVVAVAMAWGTIGLMGLGNGVVFRLVADQFPRRIGLASGIIGAAGAAGGMLLPLCLGGLKELTGSYALALWGCAVIAGAMALAVSRFPVGQAAAQRPVGAQGEACPTGASPTRERLA